MQQVKELYRWGTFDGVYVSRDAGGCGGFSEKEALVICLALDQLLSGPWNFLSSCHCTIEFEFMRACFRFLKERECNFFLILALCVSLGIGYKVEFYDGQTPCSLCFLQRIAMMGVAFSLYLNLAFGARSRYYGFALIWSLLGMTFALRHIALNICKSVPLDAFFLGAYRMYTWSFLVFFLSIAGIALLLCLESKAERLSAGAKMDKMAYVSAALLSLELLVGFISVLQHQGWGF